MWAPYAFEGMLLSGLLPVNMRSGNMLSRSSSIFTTCGHRRQRRNTLAYILDLLAFAVETGRLTEACAEVVRGLVLSPSPSDNNSLATAAELCRPSVVDDILVDQGTDHVTNMDDDTVLRDVRFRKTYNQEGVRAVACGLTPLDLPTPFEARRRKTTFHSCSRFHREFPRSERQYDEEVFGDYSTLENLLSRFEELKGTPAELIQNEIRIKKDLVRQLLDKRFKNEYPASSAEMYKRLVRALDQRAPPEQRLIKPRVINHVIKQSCKVDAVVPSCWGRKKSEGSQLFNQPSKLSDYIRTDLAASPH